MCGHYLFAKRLLVLIIEGGESTYSSLKVIENAVVSTGGVMTIPVVKFLVEGLTVCISQSEL